MKFKIVKTKPGWWYNDYVGEEFEITEFAYHKDGANHPLKIETLEQLQENLNEYPNLHMHTSRDPKGNYYGQIFGGGPYWEIHLENTNYQELIS